MLNRALTTGDMDSDGYVDIIMGSPGYSVSGSVQEGRVYIVYGNGMKTWFLYMFDHPTYYTMLKGGW